MLLIPLLGAKVLAVVSACFVYAHGYGAGIAFGAYVGTGVVTFSAISGIQMHLHRQEPDRIEILRDMIALDETKEED